MIPEEVQRDIKLFAALKPYADRDRNCTVSELRALCEDVKAAAIAYARPIVAQECAEIVEARTLVEPGTRAPALIENDAASRILADVILEKFEERMTTLAAAIREHGRSK